MDYGKLARDLLLAPARGMIAQPPETEALGWWGKLHEAIDPVRAFGGYGNMAGAIFAGPGARTANLANLKAARVLDDAGLDSGATWRMTGWNKGYGGDWKMEIPDSAAKWTSKLSEKKDWLVHGGKLSDYLDHPELFKAYPELKDYNISFSKGQVGGRGYFSEKNKEIVLDSYFPIEEQLSTALHEVQHAVQAIEGFKGRGANISQIRSKFDNAVGRRLSKTASAKEKIELERLQERAHQMGAPREAYMRDPGEAEARNVQLRHGLGRNAYDLWKHNPEVTQSYPFSKQFVID